MNSDDSGVSEEVLLLREIRNWFRAAYHESIRERLSQFLDTDKKRLAYQMADGVSTYREVAAKCSMSTKSIQDLWNEAAKRGFLESLPGGKRRRLFDLYDFGLVTGVGESED